MIACENVTVRNDETGHRNNQDYHQVQCREKTEDQDREGM